MQEPMQSVSGWSKGNASLMIRLIIRLRIFDKVSRMVMVTDYAPGALSDFLNGHNNDAGKVRKRIKNMKSIDDQVAISFKKHASEVEISIAFLLNEESTLSQPAKLCHCFFAISVYSCFLDLFPEC